MDLIRFGIVYNIFWELTDIYTKSKYVQGSHKKLHGCRRYDLMNKSSEL